MRDCSWRSGNEHPIAYSTPTPTVHARVFVRASQVLFETLGNSEGAKYAHDLTSRANRKMCKRSARTREWLTRSKPSNLSFQYDGLLCWPFTIEDDIERLVAWVL
ncbi:MAG: hypothetical protein OXG64_04080 [Chloroflexi bacterium]|nr:hypothetical protein [Chloroflexota bacterium]